MSDKENLQTSEKLQAEKYARICELMKVVNPNNTGMEKKCDIFNQIHAIVHEQDSKD